MTKQKKIEPHITLFQNDKVKDTVELVNSALRGTGLKFEAVTDEDYDLGVTYKLKGKKWLNKKKLTT